MNNDDKKYTIDSSKEDKSLFSLEENNSNKESNNLEDFKFTAVSEEEALEMRCSAYDYLVY